MSGLHTLKQKQEVETCLAHSPGEQIFNWRVSRSYNTFMPETKLTNLDWIYITYLCPLLKHQNRYFFSYWHVQRTDGPVGHRKPLWRQFWKSFILRGEKCVLVWTEGQKQCFLMLPLGVAKVRNVQILHTVAFSNISQSKHGNTICHFVNRALRLFRQAQKLFYT